MNKALLLLGCMAPMFLFGWEESEVVCSDNEKKVFSSTCAEKEVRADFGRILKIHGFTPEAYSNLLREVKYGVLDVIFTKKEVDMYEVKKIVHNFCKNHSVLSSKAKLWADSMTEHIEGRIKNVNNDKIKEENRRLGLTMKTVTGKLVPLSEAEEARGSDASIQRRTVAYRDAVAFGSISQGDVFPGGDDEEH